MDIMFGNRQMARACNDSTERKRRFGPERATRLGIRLDQMRSSNTLAVFKLVHPRCHQLKANRSGQWSADLDGPYRLIFEIADDPIPLDDRGNVDAAAVRKVRIINVANTHGL